MSATTVVTDAVTEKFKEAIASLQTGKPVSQVLELFREAQSLVRRESLLLNPRFGNYRA
jgi:hypothetical protein